MSITAQFDASRLLAILPRYAEEMGRTTPDTLTRAAKGVTRRLLSITPPFSAETTAAAAFRQGKLRIAHQLSHVFAPVRLKGTRRIVTVFGRRLARPIVVPTVERWPDVAGIYRTNTRQAAGRPGIRLTNAAAKYYVDRRKFQALLVAKQAAVGRLASMWFAAASRLGVTVPSWVSRHGPARGTIELQLQGDVQSITIAGHYPAEIDPRLSSHLARIAPYALDYQAAAMEREIRYYLAKSAGAAGLTVEGSFPPPPVIDV